MAVVGLGAIGGIVAGFLAAAGRHDVTACVRHPMARLTLEHPGGVDELALRTLADPAEAEPVDWVLLCTKTYQTAASAGWLARLAGPHTRLAVLQNGIGHVARLAPLAGPATVIPTVVYYNGERLAADRVRYRPAGDRDLALADDADGRAFARLFEATPLRIDMTDDFATLAWRKLLINAVANPITALTLQRQSVFRRDDVQALCLAVLDEAAAVGRADGARLEADEAARILRTLLTYPPQAGTSMYFDRLSGRPTEVDELTGGVVAAGERLGVPTPLNRALLTLLRASGEMPPRS